MKPMTPDLTALVEKMEMIKIQPSATADTRTCDFANVTKDTLLASSKQPIETAPKDGTWLLLTYPKAISTDIGRWTQHDSGYPCKGSRPGFIYRRSQSVRFDRDHQPTHWMPLPAPPTGTPIPACQREVMRHADDSAAYLSVPCTCGTCHTGAPTR